MTAVQGFNARLNQTPLIAVTVKGAGARKGRARGRPPRERARVGALGRLGAEDQGLRAADRDRQQLHQDSSNAALNASSLSTTDKILLQGRLQGCQADLTTTTQLYLLAKNVEAPRIITHAVAEKTAARSHRNATAVGALIGLILGGIAALVWDPSRVGAPGTRDARQLHRPGVQRGGDAR